MLLLGDSALTVQPITLLYTIFDWRGAPWGAESSQHRSHTNFYQSREVQKYKFNDFCRNILYTIIWKTKYNQDDGEPGERNGSEAVVETIAAKRPMMHDEYNLC